MMSARSVAILATAAALFAAPGPCALSSLCMSLVFVRVSVRWTRWCRTLSMLLTARDTVSFATVVARESASRQDCQSTEGSWSVG
jgi:hypothetical protein